MKRLIAMLLGCCLLASPWCPLRAQPPAQKYALLVGCTDYQNVPLPALQGPHNDVRLLAALLEKDFGFPAAHITQLVGWPSDPAQRPTYANIVKAFTELISKAGPGVQIFISMSGHGVQIPIPETQKDPLDPKNPEPDGMDEVFLPADVLSWESPGQVRNAILDDQFGDWLDQLRAKGAQVWIVFDCCHSGTMMRGSELEERSRQVRPQDLHIPDAAIASAAKRAAAAVTNATNQGERSRGTSVLEPTPLGLKKGTKGSVVAFYAAQSFETAPELPRPAGAARSRDNYYGLLSFTLAGILKQRHSPMSYRELAQALVARYTAERGSRGPTPFFEGDLDHEVLGLNQWPERATMLLKREEKTLFVTAGALRGLTPGSVLSLHPPAGDKRPMEEVMGYVKVKATGLTPDKAEVEPCAFAKLPVVPADKLPALARAKLAARDLGDLRVQLCVRPAQAADEGKAAVVRQVLQQMDPAIRDLVRADVAEAKAEWLLWIDQGRVTLRPGAGLRLEARGQEERQRSVITRPIYGDYALADAAALTRQLERAVQTIFTWQNVWRIAGLGSQEGKGDNHGLKFTVMTLKEDKTPVGPLVQGSPVATGQRLQVQLANEGASHLWVTLLLLDADFGIDVRSFALKAGSSLARTLRITADSFGKEGIVVLAVPQDISREQPFFDFLQQPSLQAKIGTPRGERERSAAGAPDTPFGQLLTAAAIGKGTMRSFQEEVPTNPALLSWSWLSLPATAKKVAGQP